MPVKNADPYLSEAICSLRDQDFRAWELIAIDDRSSDGSLEILKQSEKDDPRVRVYSNSGNGIVDALQLAFINSHGAYVSRFDADDIMPEKRLSTMISALESAGEGVIITGLVKYIGKQPISNGYLKYETWVNDINQSGETWQHIYRECVVASPNWVMNRSDLERVGGFNGLTYPEDYDLTFRWYQQKLKIKCLPHVTLHWREHPARTSRNSDDYSQASFFELKIGWFFKLDYDKKRPLVVWGQGKKAQLTKQQIDKAGVTCAVIDKANFDSTPFDEHPQILIAVYPSREERAAIERFLKGRSMLMGRDYWYL